MDRSFALLLFVVMYAGHSFADDVNPAGRPAPAESITLRAVQKIPSKFPLTLTIPANFRVVALADTEVVDAPDTISKLYCTEEDARLMRAQIRGQRSEEPLSTGCFVVGIDAHDKYDPGTKRFSMETIMEDSRTWGKSTAAPSFGVKINSVSKRDIRGKPTMEVDQEISINGDKARTRSLSVAEGVTVWTVTFQPGKHNGLAAPIWQIFVGGL